MALFAHLAQQQNRGLGSKPDGQGGFLPRKQLSGHTIRALIRVLESGIFTPAQMTAYYEFDADDLNELQMLRNKYQASADKNRFIEGMESLCMLMESDDQNELDLRTPATFLAALDTLG